ncbi:MAG TPA: glycoside hydrolase family 3 N-terminal domain-containing protein [Bryobacteraceae bacterium]|nr:glycoside hydrolase family 3 N-terminal domain-containing protein [Bryobacteraceae bacterium]
MALAPISGGAMFAAQDQKTRADIEAKTDALLKQMTVEEKAGQMTQVTIDLVVRNSEPYPIDPAKLETAVLRYKVGSILNVMDHGYTVDHWHDIINQIQEMAARSRLKIPVLYGLDSIHGANYVLGATLFPQALALAATWNPELAERAGEISAFQTRAAGIPWNFYPVLDVGRQPLWPRLWETYGEDVRLATEMGKAYIRGLQGNNVGAKDKVAACLKHYAGYSFPFNGKDRTPAHISERMMRQYFLPTFEAGVKAGVPTVMVNSGEIDGIPGHANYHLLTEILKNEWGFQGFVVSDWQDIERLHTRDRVADSPKEAVRMAVMAGLDMSMVPNDFSFYDLLLESVKDGSVPMARIDDAVRRILRVKFMTGIFDNPRPDPAMKARFDQPAFAEANLAAAREAITLLKNRNNVLPLARGRKILVTGPTADRLTVLNGGWSTTWPGDREDLYPKDKLTIRRAIELAAGKDHVTFAPGTTFDKEIDMASTVAAAADADVIVACLGEPAYCETPGNIDDLTLDAAQLRLVEELSKTRKPLVAILAQGRARVIRAIADVCDAIVMACLPGLEGGRAVADVLFGDVNPSGKLPVTYPRHPNALTTYDYKVSETLEGNRIDPEFEFGHGLSYTTFEYSNLRLSSDALRRNGELKASVSVKNTGTRAGKEVVQLYVSDLYRSLTPPNRELKGFRKVELHPGESRNVEFTLTAADLAFVGINNRWMAEPGKFRVRVAQLAQEFTLE